MAPSEEKKLHSVATCACVCEMGTPWIIVSILLCVSAWESAGITNKGRPPLQEGFLRNFRHVAGPSTSVNTDWEVGLREAANQALLRERYHDYNLRERLLDAPLIGRRDVATRFGDIVVLARGQLYVTDGGDFLFVQDQYQNGCDACHNSRPRCDRSSCQIWRPDQNEHLVALWTVKRIRHRHPNNGHYYELEYIISPITPTISEFVTRNGHFDYGIPGHIFVVRNDKVAQNQPEPTFASNRHIARHHFKPEVLIGVTEDGEKHILHSYPGFYTSFPVHPTYHQNRYSTNDPREIELYKELIESLAAKTSSTQKAETGPHKFSLNGYTEPTTNEVESTKADYDVFPATQNTMAEQSTRPLTSSATTLVQFPQTYLITKPSVGNMIPTKPTELNSPEIFHSVATKNPEDDHTPEVTQPITTIHYFTPIGEEDLIPDDVTEMKKITLGAITKKPEESGADFLFPDLETTAPAKTTRKYYKHTTINQDVSNILEEPTSSSSQTTKQYQTTATRTEAESPSTTTETPKTSPGITTLKPTTIRSSTARQRPSTDRSRPSKMTTTVFKVPKTPESTTQTLRTTPISRTKSVLPKITTTKATTKINTSTATPKTTTEVASTATKKVTTPKLRPTKTKMSNLTGFIGSTTITGANRITTYKPKYTKITPPKTTTTPETTTTQAPSSKMTTERQSTAYKPKYTKVTAPTLTRSTTTAPIITTLATQAPSTKRTTLEQSATPRTFAKTTRPQKPTIDLDYTLLEDISPTEPMQATLQPKETQDISATEPMQATLQPKDAQDISPIEPMQVTLQPKQTQDISPPTEPMQATLQPKETQHISPTEPMQATLQPKGTQVTSVSSTIDYTSATSPSTTIATSQISHEFSDGNGITTETKKSSETLFTSPGNTPAIIVTAKETFSTTAESFKASTVTQGNETDKGVTLQEKMERTTQSTTAEMPNLFSSEVDAGTTAKTSTIFTTFKPSTVPTTSVTNLNTATIRAQTATTFGKFKPSATTTNDFLTENGNGNAEKPSFTKPSKPEFDEFDIFGSTETGTRPTEASPMKKITESDLAGELFGSRSPKALEPDTVLPKGTKIIYSNFFEASTNSMPQTTEHTTTAQPETYETTTNVKPLTSQSYATSISFKVKKKNDTSTEYGNTDTTPAASVSDFTEGKDNGTESTTTATETSTTDMKKSFDRLALQLINHAKGIDYLSEANNKTTRAKYKRRKTYVARNKRINKRKQIS